MEEALVGRGGHLASSDRRLKGGTALSAVIYDEADATKRAFLINLHLSGVSDQVRGVRCGVCIVQV